MRRVGKGFSGVETPLFEKEVVTDIVSPTPTPPSPPSPVLDTCSALARRVEGLENDTAAQQLEIVKLKARVKKLEKINMVKSSKLRRLKKVGTSQRVESSDDMENVLSMQEDDTEVQEVVEIVTTAKLITEVVTAAATQVVAASKPIPVVKLKILTITAAPVVSIRRRKGVVIKDPEEGLPSNTPAETSKVKDKGKGILIEAPKPIKKKDRIEMDAEYARKLQEEINKEHKETYKNIDWNAALDHVQSKEPQKVSVVDYEIVMINNKPRYKIIKADGTHQLYISFITLLKNFDKEDLEDLWRIVKASFSTSKPTNFSDDYLLSILKTMFEKTDGQDAIWRNQQSVYGQALVKSWKLLTSCGVHIISLATTTFILLVEKRYPFSKFTLEQLVNVVRLKVEEESDMSLELLRFTRQQL
nr:hypothetical protein [Tanacetum cinerariifolium]